MDWLDLTVRTKGDTAVNRLRRLLAQQRRQQTAAALDRLAVLQAQEELQKEERQQQAERFGMAYNRLRLAATSRKPGTLAPVYIGFRNDIDPQYQRIIPILSDGSVYEQLQMPLAPTPPSPISRAQAVSLGVPRRELFSSGGSGMFLLPVERDRGIIVTVWQQAYYSVEWWAGGINIRGAPVPNPGLTEAWNAVDPTPSSVFSDYFSSLGTADQDADPMPRTNFVGNPVPYIGERAVHAYVYNSQGVREITVPPAIEHICQRIAPEPIDTAVILGGDSYYQGRYPWNNDYNPTNAEIAAVFASWNLTREPVGLSNSNPASDSPMYPYTMKTGWGYQGIYNYSQYWASLDSQPRGWTPAVYLWLDDLLGDNQSDAYPEDVAAALLLEGAINANFRWAHHAIEGNTYEVHELADVWPTGEPFSLASVTPLTVPPWEPARLAKFVNNRVEEAAKTVSRYPGLSVWANNSCFDFGKPSYCRSKLFALGFSEADLTI